MHIQGRVLFSHDFGWLIFWRGAIHVTQGPALELVTFCGSLLLCDELTDGEMVL